MKSWCWPPGRGFQTVWSACRLADEPRHRISLRGGPLAKPGASASPPNPVGIQCTEDSIVTERQGTVSSRWQQRVKNWITAQDRSNQEVTAPLLICLRVLLQVYFARTELLINWSKIFFLSSKTRDGPDFTSSSQLLYVPHVRHAVVVRASSEHSTVKFHTEEVSFVLILQDCSRLGKWWESLSQVRTCDRNVFMRKTSTVKNHYHRRKEHIKHITLKKVHIINLNSVLLLPHTSTTRIPKQQGCWVKHEEKKNMMQYKYNIFNAASHQLHWFF